MFNLSIAKNCISFLAEEKQDLVRMSTWMTLLTGCFPFRKMILNIICDSQHVVLISVAPPGKLLAMPIPTGPVESNTGGRSQQTEL